MNWEAIGAIGDLLGGTAVLITLLYLALQVKDARNALKAQTAQNRTAIAIDLAKWLAELRRQYPDEAEYDEEARVQMMHHLSSNMLHLQNLYYQRKIGNLDEFFQGSISARGFRHLKDSRFNLESWKQLSQYPAFDKEFVRFVNEAIESDHNHGGA